MKFRQWNWIIDTHGWYVSESPECVTVESPDQKGALQISWHRKTSGDIRADEITELANEHLGDRSATLSEAEVGAMQAYESEYVDGSTYWRKWWVFERNTLLFITFNCDLSYQASKIDTVNAVVASLEITDA